MERVKSAAPFGTGCLSVSCLLLAVLVLVLVPVPLLSSPCQAGRDRAWTPSRALGQLRQLPQNLGNETCWERRRAQYGVIRRGSQSRVRHRWQMQASRSVAAQFEHLLSLSDPLFFSIYIYFFLKAEFPLCVYCSMGSPS